MTAPWSEELNLPGSGADRSPPSDAGPTHLHPNLLYDVQFFEGQRMLGVIDGANQMWQVKERGLCCLFPPLRTLRQGCLRRTHAPPTPGRHRCVPRPGPREPARARQRRISKISRASMLSATCSSSSTAVTGRSPERS